MYSFPNFEPVFCSLSGSVTFWSAYSFLSRHVRWWNLSLFFIIIINKNILMLRLPALCCKLLFNLAPPPASSEQWSQGFLRYLFPKLDVLKNPTE